MTKGIDMNVEIGAATTRISELARSTDLTTSVPHLGRWRVRDVVAHLGGVHRWAARIVTTRSMDGPGFTKSKLDGVQLCDWFDDGVDELLAVLGAADPGEPCPNFNPGSSKTVGWWQRRQLHETTVHRWDVERAIGSTTSIKPTVAADGIDEFLDTFVRTRGKQTLTGSVVLTTARPPRAWTLTPADKPGRVDVMVGRRQEAVFDAEVSGKPDRLLLALWGRLSPTEAELDVQGDPAVAAAMFGD